MSTPPPPHLLSSTATERTSAVFERPTVFGSGRLQPGGFVGRYRLDEFLGRGGMGEVWKAFDPVVETHLVIKLLPPDLFSNPTEVERVRQSFRKVADLPHQNICPVYQFDMDPVHGPYLTMKYIAGIHLSLYRLKYVEQHGSFPPAEVERVLRPIATALDYAHEKGVIHRDVKPENILVGSDGSDPQLVDFGLAAEIKRSLSRVSQVRWESSGTLVYMAPEQWRGRPQDGRTDQYALAAVAFELLTGHPPFDSAEMDVLSRCILSEPPPPLPGDSARSAVLAQGLAKDPLDRFPSCTALIEALANPPVLLTAVKPPRQSHPTRGRHAGWLEMSLGVTVLSGLGWYFTQAATPSPTVATASPAPQAVAVSTATPPPPLPLTTASTVPASPAPLAVPVTTPSVAAVNTVPPSQPTPVSQTPVLANLPVAVSPDLLTPAEWAKTRSELESKQSRLLAQVVDYRSRLSDLPQLGESAEAVAIHKQLASAGSAFDRFRVKYTEIGTLLAGIPPQSRTAAATLVARVDALAAETIDAKTIEEWQAEVVRNRVAYENLRKSLENSRVENLAQLHAAVRAKGKALSAAAEAASTGGYDVDTPKVKEVREDLHSRRKQLRQSLGELAVIEKELASPLDRQQISKLMERVRVIPVFTDDWRFQTAKLAEQVKQEAKGERRRFEARVDLLGKADEEAQWFICTDGSGAVKAVELGERAQMTTDGQIPFRRNRPDSQLIFSSGCNMATEGHGFFAARPFTYNNRQRQPQTVLLDCLCSDSIIKKYAINKHLHSWRFALYASEIRQIYVPYNERDKDALEAKRAEMCKALTNWLNIKYEKLDLKVEEVSIKWQTVPDKSDEDELRVTLENMFGGFRVSVIAPKLPPPGLTGDGDAEYAEVLAEARRLATGVATPVSRSILTPGSVWTGTLTQSRSRNSMRITVTAVEGDILLGQIENVDVRSRVAFTGKTTGSEVILTTCRPAYGSVAIGAVWSGRLEGKQLAGQWTHGIESGDFALARESDGSRP